MRQLLPDEKRVMPPTRPDEAAYWHRALCECEVCKRPQAQRYFRRRRRDRGLKP